MNKIKKMIMLLLIFMLILTIILVVILKNSKSESENIDYGEYPSSQEKEMNTVQFVTDVDTFFSMKKCVEKYYLILKIMVTYLITQE